MAGAAARAIRVGIVGAGSNTKLHHIPKLKAIQGVEIVAVANRTDESGARVAKEFGIPKVAKNWREIVEDKDIDAVVIGTWPYLHSVITVAALEAGKHVLTEARMARNAAEAHRMYDAAQRNPQLVAQIVPSPFTLPFDATIQDIINAGTLGDLTYIDVKGVGNAFPDPPGSPISWRQDIELSGFNILMMGIFYEPLQRWVGDANSVTALAKTVVKLRKDPETNEPKGVQVPDHINILADMACGAQAHLVFSAITGAARPPLREYYLYGTEGTLHLDVDASKLYLAQKSEGGGFKEVPIASEKRSGWRVEEEFIGAIRGTERVRRTDFAAGVQYMEFTEAVTRSFQQGRSIALPL
ncbi:hypothetical protein WJX72_008581 [[Myrmecia] bisecta]|uniref:Gfo/Idh/MocA-like oxidoreductase N-terminal domain-containing protein n=1 Tax=[Myrmecia] bisecta TaxID=41462 RepID=A0AAW1Q8E3_9CHLO